MSGVDAVRGFRRLRALVIGDAMLDSYLEGTAARLSSEGPVPVVRRTTERRVPGGAANTAANIKALGADVMFLGIVGRDIAGTLLRTALRDQGVDGRWLVEDPSTDTLHKLRIMADGQYLVRFDEGERGSYSTRARESVITRLDRLFPRCDLVVISDYGYGVVTDALIARLRALRASRPCPLLVDSKDLPRFRDAGATVVTPNHLEAQLAVGRLAGPMASPPSLSLTEENVERPHALEEVGRRLLDVVDAAHIAITMAGDGVLLLDRDGPTVHLPAHPVAHANDVGAGDSFAAAMALGLAVGADMAEAGRIGIDAGSIAVTKKWTAVVHHQELLQRVSLRDYATRPHPAADLDDRPGPTVPDLAARLERERRDGKTIVFTNGVFDILHAGHVGFLRQAKGLGDILVVGVNSDTSVERLTNGPGSTRGGTAINSERDRLALVAALDPIDHAILFDEENPAAMIRALRPHVHVKGGDYADEALPEADAVREVNGCIVILPLVGSLSTSRRGPLWTGEDRLAALVSTGTAGTTGTAIAGTWQRRSVAVGKDAEE